VVGNPRFDSEEFPSLERLPESEVEARTVAGLYSDSELLTGEAATRTRFLESASRHSVVHFAGHAIANAEFPLLSRLVLAPDRSAPTAGSGALFARELYSTRFPMTRLVVLAGCHTSSGVVVKGEGVMSLARPFLAAGVPAVVATLWDLEDRAGNEIFSVFHRRFREGDEPMEALRRAQLALISNSDPALQSPKAWAGLQVFVASGNPSLKGAGNGL
jgi:CHAT domain-containing protein